ncbi:MAG TPA: hypothetical protein VMX13_10705 [Sedimentisphaerales bacterium]|nr:hypothetical protein [Sedimentisphaerales bacterium]
MDMTRQEARDSLDQIRAVVNQTRRKLAAGSTAPALIVWGAIWFIAYLGTYMSYLLGSPSYFVQLSDHINIGINMAGLCWLLLIPIGVAASWFIEVRRAPTKRQHNKRWGLCFLVLFVYAGVWLALLRPWNEYQMSAFLASVPMFAYILAGVWADRVLLWVGVVVTLLILFGFFLLHFQPLFWLWMAVLGGGTLAGTGLYIRLCWR